MWALNIGYLVSDFIVGLFQRHVDTIWTWVLGFIEKLLLDGCGLGCHQFP